MNETRDQILALLTKAEEAIPSTLQPDLPPGENPSGSPEWHSFEHLIWALGEDIRQLFIKNRSLRKDVELQCAILRIATNSKAKRGRQSFITLFGYTIFAKFANQIAGQLSDLHVCGHAIDTLLNMRSSKFVNEVEPFTRNKTTWVRNKAKRYIDKGVESNLDHWLLCIMLIYCR